ncbi:MAG: protein-L-isoaspartate(D-aspartate) O-methyltransferase [Sandaracinaceae bacterium]|nr:protein-L-isoaspartate(D-aspartate) O-methyltransferase [Sandaracinaceae bacterium]
MDGSVDPYRPARERMVAEQLVTRGVRDPRVLEAMRAVPRERFVPERRRGSAFDDRALPLDEGQTISQPYMVARTCELAAVPVGGRVLDVGTGSGYQAAVLAAMGLEVVSIERLEPLARAAARTLAALGYDVEVVVGDGSRGWAARAPYDAIVCAAAAPGLPPSWGEQLAIGGRAVLPIGSRSMQQLTVITRVGVSRFQSVAYEACVYVPLIGAEGWSS